ncbi:hypothetical protein HDU96_009835 [Phlyctochytrium bullatum]|nr:hypothetical protein HDU96_009835 [Phlyctochytrium bullatum]
MTIPADTPLPLLGNSPTNALPPFELPLTTNSMNYIAESTNTTRDAAILLATLSHAARGSSPKQAQEAKEAKEAQEETQPKYPSGFEPVDDEGEDEEQQTSTSVMPEPLAATPLSTATAFPARDTSLPSRRRQPLPVLLSPAETPAAHFSLDRGIRARAAQPTTPQHPTWVGMYPSPLATPISSPWHSPVSARTAPFQGPSPTTPMSTRAPTAPQPQLPFADDGWRYASASLPRSFSVPDDVAARAPMHRPLALSSSAPSVAPRASLQPVAPPAALSLDRARFEIVPGDNADDEDGSAPPPAAGPADRPTDAHHPPLTWQVHSPAAGSPRRVTRRVPIPAPASRVAGDASDPHRRHPGPAQVTASAVNHRRKLRGTDAPIAALDAPASPTDDPGTAAHVAPSAARAFPHPARPTPPQPEHRSPRRHSRRTPGRLPAAPVGVLPVPIPGTPQPQPQQRAARHRLPRPATAVASAPCACVPATPRATAAALRRSPGARGGACHWEGACGIGTCNGPAASGENGGGREGACGVGGGGR